MGQLLSSPEHCDSCKKEQPTWKVVYENSQVDDFNDRHNLIVKVNKKDDKIFYANPEGQMMEFSDFLKPLDFAHARAAEIKHITGNIRITLSTKVHMEQFFCDECHAKLNLFQLPEEWGFEAFEDRKGFVRIDLP